MESLIKGIGASILIQGAMYLQMVLFMRLLLPMRELDVLKHIVLWIGVCISLVVFVLAGYDSTAYFIIMASILTLCLFKGKFAHKLLGITISIAFNFIIESILVYMIGGKLDQIIMDEDILEIVMRLENLVVVLMIIAILKVIGIDKRRSNKKQLLPRKEAIILTGITVFSTSSVYIGMNIVNGEVKVVGNVYFFIGLIVVGIILNLGIILLMDRNVHMRYYKTLSEMADRQLNEQVKYYEVLKKSQIEICSMRHDMKNHLLCIQMLAREKDLEGIEHYIQKLACNVKKSTIQVYTGNPIVDALLNEKLSKVQDKGIKIETVLDKLCEINMDQMDLCIILSNALDNAIEAVEKVVSTKDPVIMIEIKLIRGYFIIYIKNSIQEPVVIKKKHMIATTKEDRLHHGYGLKNIKEVVEKYEGVLKLTSDNEFFTLEIMIQTEFNPIQ